MHTKRKVTDKQKWQRLPFDYIEFHWLRTSDEPFLGCAFYFHAGERAEFQIGLVVLGDLNGQPLQTQIFDEVGVALLDCAGSCTDRSNVDWIAPNFLGQRGLECALLPI